MYIVLATYDRLRVLFTTHLNIYGTHNVHYALNCGCHNRTMEPNKLFFVFFLDFVGF